ncbi:MAG: HK97 gp10 family phage protein [Actinobacteria bacterium]|nr:HK97 gp10 family phage protein [Actinomycetota bacterium]
MADVDITYHKAVEVHILRAPGGPVHRRVDEVLSAVEAIATASAPVDTGYLRNNRTKAIHDEGTRLVGELTYHADYALAVMKGTGIYGPRARPITPKRGKYLVFRGRDGGLVYARSVRGQRANPFLVNALKAASPWPVNEH